MSPPSTIDPVRLKAIDVHVHMESAAAAETVADATARKYFGDGGAPRDPEGLAEYYRSRQIACVVFSVDERLTGRPPVPNDTVADFANGLDTFNFSLHSTVDAFSDLTIGVQGADALVTFNGGQLLITGAMGLIESSDFVFV